MDMQNVSNLTIPEGQVRTIHDKDSRLIWGRVAYNTKYAGDTFQQTYSGKNLFNYQGVVNLAIATTIAGRSTYRGYYIQANAGDTFTLSRATTTGNNRFRVCFTMVEPARGVDAYNENGVVERYISADNATEVSFTVPQDMHYVFIYLDNSGQDITESLKIQLETGSTATAYEPYVGGIPSPNPDYPQDVNVVTGEQTITISDDIDSEVFPVSLGSLELCKIGSYQDYIYKNNGVWYIHKETGKIDLTSTTGWWKSGIHTVKNSLANLGITNIHTTNQSLATEAKCNYFEAAPTLPLYQGSIAVGFGISDGFYFSNNNWSLNDFNAFKTDHTVLVYYALANAINTAIPNTALIDQLNAVHEWLTRYGYNATVSGNLPIVLQRDSLQ